jgi:hypothetical protein
MKSPEEVKLNREEGEALIERIKASDLRSEDQGLLVKLIGVYFWLTLALQETKISLSRSKFSLTPQYLVIEQVARECNHSVVQVRV